MTHRRFATTTAAFVLLFLAAPVPGEDASKLEITPLETSSFSVRDHHWGDNIGMIIDGESVAPAHQTSDSVFFVGDLAGMKALLYFAFIDGGLYQVVYKFTERHIQNAEYVSEFEAIDDLLHKKYGKPTSSGPVWINDIWRDDSIADALSVGAVKLVSTWQLDGAVIRHALSLDDDLSVDHLIAYVDPAALQKLKSRKDADTLEAL